jgi:DNA-binding transcriptional LysR family regulator
MAEALIELRLWRQFIAVAEELHFGRAAQRLHMTQPPLTQAIANIERQLGARLFDRTKRSVKLTATGQALLPEARELLARA